MNFKSIIFLFALCLNYGLTNAQYHIQRNTVYGELFGVGEFYTINIDHVINEFHHNSETFRAGISFRPGNSYYLTTGLNFMHGIKRQKDRYIEMGIGATYKNEYSKGKATGEKYTFLGKSDSFGYLSIGYRKQGTKKEPLFWKVAFTPLILRNIGDAVKGSNVGWLGYFMPSIGASVGYSF